MQNSLTRIDGQNTIYPLISPVLLFALGVRGGEFVLVFHSIWFHEVSHNPMAVLQNRSISSSDYRKGEETILLVDRPVGQGHSPLIQEFLRGVHFAYFHSSKDEAMKVRNVLVRNILTFGLYDRSIAFNCAGFTQLYGTRSQSQVLSRYKPKGSRSIHQAPSLKGH